MKTDTRLKRDVEAELEWDPALNATAIGVAVVDGVVTLSGHIDSFVEKIAAERAARRVAGVKAIALELDVKLSPSHHRSDTDIAAAAKAALLWNTEVDDKVQVSVENGWLTLRGETEWAFQRADAEAAVRSLKGVRGISNLIAIKPKLSPSDIRHKILASFRRQAEREADHIEIRADGHTVTLSGTVHSWHEREAAQGVAWSTPGVGTVVNELVIG